MKEFSEDIKNLLAERFPGRNIYEMDLNELKEFKEEVVDLRHEYALLENAYKVCANAGYGSSANEHFYFFLPKLASDITGECRNLTKTMWHNLEEFFHETLWERKDIQEQFGFELDETKHDWYREQPISVYSDTDSTSFDTILKTSNGECTIENLFNESLKQNGIKDITNNGHEIVKCNDDVLNWTKENGLNFVPIKWIMRHKVSKPMFKITTKSGKTITVTEDHSCIVFRNGEQIAIKAKDINKETDKILLVIS